MASRKKGGLVLNGHLDQRLQICEFGEKVKSPGSQTDTAEVSRPGCGIL